MNTTNIVIFMWLTLLTVFTFWWGFANFRLHNLNRGVWEAQIQLNQHFEQLLDNPQK